MNYNKIGDTQLLAYIVKGDQNAFEYLFDTYFEKMYNYISLFIPERQVAEEGVMDIFMYVWDHRKEIVIRTSLKAYLYQSVHNKALNILKKQRRQKVISLEGCIPELSFIQHYQLDNSDLGKFISGVIDGLPEKCREVFMLSREKGMSNDMIAERMNISVKTVEAHITKALKSVRYELKHNYYTLFF